MPWVALVWQLISIFLLLAASWRLASALFVSQLAEDERARWAAVALMTALLTLPIAGTALYILDQFLNPRNLAAFAALFAVAEVLHRRFLRVMCWLAFGAGVHPLMASFAILFCAWLVLLGKSRPRILGFDDAEPAIAVRQEKTGARISTGFAIALPFGITFAPPPVEYHEVALLQRSHFVLRWEWYEWLGVIAPVLLFWWLGSWTRVRGLKNLELVSRAMVPFVLIASAAAIVLGSSLRLEALARLQPLRCMALCYMVLVVAGGGLLGRYVLRARVWRWLALFVPLGVGMYVVQQQVFPASQHLEWPCAQPSNPWAQAFDWIRRNTPVDSLFVLNPAHMDLPGEDENGFRARSERSMLADLVKDKGSASMFPPLSVKWAEQIADEKNWNGFGQADFERLQTKYGVSWVVVEQHIPPQSGMQCPYRNSTVRVCRLD